MAERFDLLGSAALGSRMMMDALPPERRWQAAAGAKHWGSVADAQEKGEPINWNSFCGSCEIFHAMGIPSIMQEGIGVMATALPGKLNEKYIDIAHENLVADHVCSTQKVMMGAALCGDLPPPTTIVHSGQPCDSTIVTYSTMANHLGVPHFTLDIPGFKDERTVQYVADELERMVAFLEEHTGKTLEDEKLREVMEYSNIAHEYSLKVNELTKMVPSPLPRMLATPLMDSAGTPEGAEYYKKLYEMGKAVVDSGKGYAQNQRYRAALFSTWVATDPLFLKWLEEDFGVIIVNSMLGTDTSRPAHDISSRRKMMEALARKQINAPMSRECWASLDDWLQYAIPACRDWKIDVVILTLHIGCKNIWAVQKLFKDRLADELGIPAVIAEVDFCDGRVFSAESIRAQISDFFNTIMA